MAMERPQHHNNGSELAAASLAQPAPAQPVDEAPQPQLTPAEQQQAINLQVVNQQLQTQIDELMQHNEELRLLSEMSDRLQTCTTVQEAFQATALFLETIFPEMSGAFFCVNGDQSRMELVASWGRPVLIKSFSPLECWSIRYERPHKVRAGQMSFRCPHLSMTQIDNEHCCFPLVAQGKALGILHLEMPAPEHLTTSQQQFAQLVTKQVSTIIANLRLREKLRERSLRDHLTGLFNRRYLEEALAQEILRAERHRYPIGIMMFDIDHFKQLNDQHGHPAGDLMLQEISWVIRNNIRDSDLACRYGGEEFLIIMPDTSLTTTLARAEVLRTAIASVRIGYPGSPVLSVTASFGIAIFPDHGQNYGQLIQSADQALYDAKASDRNCVMIAPREARA